MLRALIILGLLIQAITPMPAACRGMIAGMQDMSMACEAMPTPPAESCCGMPDRPAREDQGPGEPRRCSGCPLPSLPPQAPARATAPGPVDLALPAAPEPRWALFEFAAPLQTENMGSPPGVKLPLRVLHGTWVI